MRHVIRPNQTKSDKRELLYFDSRYAIFFEEGDNVLVEAVEFFNVAVTVALDIVILFCLTVEAQMFVDDFEIYQLFPHLLLEMAAYKVVGVVRRGEPAFSALVNLQQFVDGAIIDQKIFTNLETRLNAPKIGFVYSAR